MTPAAIAQVYPCNTDPVANLTLSIDEERLWHPARGR